LDSIGTLPIFPFERCPLRGLDKASSCNLAEAVAEFRFGMF